MPILQWRCLEVPKMDLAKQIGSMNYAETDEEDFDEIIDSKVFPVSD